MLSVRFSGLSAPVSPRRAASSERRLLTSSLSHLFSFTRAPVASSIRFELCSASKTRYFIELYDAFASMSSQVSLSTSARRRSLSSLRALISSRRVSASERPAPWLWGAARFCFSGVLPEKILFSKASSSFFYLDSDRSRQAFRNHSSSDAVCRRPPQTSTALIHASCSSPHGSFEKR